METEQEVRSIVSAVGREYHRKVLDRGMLSIMALEIGTLPCVRRLSEHLNDRKRYPTRPALLLCGKPSVYLLGWREGEGTGVHDHGLSEVAIHVIQGTVTEDLYVTEEAPGNMRKVMLSFSRNLRQGDLVTCPANYIHLVKNIFPETATTLHVYGPKLGEMNSYHDKISHLLFKEHWAAHR